MEDNILYVALLITGVVAVLSFVSIKGLNPIKIENSDKIGHWLAYFTLGITWYVYALLHKKKIAVVFLILVGYGIIIEVCQGLFTLNRQFDVFDMMANTLGLALAWIIVSFLYKKN
ncbi:VanZ family protein [Flavobacteriaceae bacterium F08102]|nr:VanZ family protein [Flavobacteriaceae bacterium F08102]